MNEGGEDEDACYDAVVVAEHWGELEFDLLVMVCVTLEEDVAEYR